MNDQYHVTKNLLEGRTTNGGKANPATVISVKMLAYC